MPITSYEKYMSEAKSKGKLANYQDYSAITKGAAADVAYGIAVQLGTDPETVVPFAGSTPEGIALAREQHDWITNADDQFYPVNKPVAVVTKGVIWVEVEEDVLSGDTPVVDNATGNFRPSSTATTEVTEMPSAKFRSAAAAGDLAQLEINLP
ncbi:structural cement protein Gp24 [Virgibacillus sediminis]|uniref:Phage tail protein n=1 Tax=Virgibacillus sediminis TaxID=202260 RepID=A0ABV7A624_9BACI